MTSTANPELTAANGEATSLKMLVRERDYASFWVGRFASMFATQTQSITIGWQVYAIARLTRSIAESAFMVGMVGLAAFIPIFLLTLPGGEAADRHDRKTIWLICLVGQLLSVGVLTLSTLQGWVSVWVLLGVSVMFGIIRAHSNPATAAIAPMMVPRPLLPRAIAWNSLAAQSARIAGPAAGGILIAISPAAAYAAAALLYALAIVAVARIRRSTRPTLNPGSRWALMREGLVYVWRNQVVFGAISLDLVAVLLGGATALLPVFAKDVLRIGAEGFGLLRAAPAMGSTTVGVFLAIAPINRKAGVVMLAGVATFGLATMVFALSKILWLSMLALFVLGGADMLSMFIRQTLVQLSTPDAMRGRVAAVSSVFISASNELGEFESGIVTRFIGPVLGALVGGVAAVAATGLWAVLFPKLRNADRLE